MTGSVELPSIWPAMRPTTSPGSRSEHRRRGDDGRGVVPDAGPFLLLFLRTAREVEECQQLLDFAQARGVEVTLSEPREPSLPAMAPTYASCLQAAAGSGDWS